MFRASFIMTILCTWMQIGHAQTNDKIDFILTQNLSREGQADVVIYMREKANLKAATQNKNRVARIRYVYNQLRATAEKSQKNILAMLKKENIPHRSFYIENAVVVKKANAELLNRIAAMNEVQKVRLNFRSELNLQPAKKSRSSLTDQIPDHLQFIGADKVWELGVKGKGIVIAGQDTGFFWQHNAIKKQYRGNKSTGVDHNYNWHDAIHASTGSKARLANCPPDSPAPCDDDAHGTHTMGTMVGFDGDKNRIGVAPEAQWIGCRNMEQGVGTVDSYMECFEYFLAPYPIGGNPKKDGKPEYAPHIINNSWGCPGAEGCTGGELLAAVQAMKAAGILVVAAAGNEGPNCGSVGAAPGHYANELLSVGALNSSFNDIAFFSSRGPSVWNSGLAPNISAPGDGIRSAVSSGPDSYMEFSGTSMASPHVAGAAALLWSAKPELIGQIDKTIAILHKSAHAKTTNQTCGKFPGNTTPNAVFGFGTLNIFDAIKSL